MNDVTRILHAIESGDPQAARDLLPLVYEELRRLAAARLSNEGAPQTLQATALVHEAYLRLVADDDRTASWNSRGHFFAAAAEAMRRILIDRARARGRLKRGGQRLRIELADLEAATPEADETLLALDEALQALAREDPPKAELVKLRYFAGLTLPEAADLLNISRATASRQWAYARAWLFHELSGGGVPAETPDNS